MIKAITFGLWTFNVALIVVIGLLLFIAEHGEPGPRMNYESPYPKNVDTTSHTFMFML